MVLTDQLIVEFLIVILNFCNSGWLVVSDTIKKSGLLVLRELHATSSDRLRPLLGLLLLKEFGSESIKVALLGLE